MRSWLACMFAVGRVCGKWSVYIGIKMPVYIGIGACIFRLVGVYLQNANVGQKGSCRERGRFALCEDPFAGRVRPGCDFHTVVIRNTTRRREFRRREEAIGNRS